MTEHNDQGVYLTQVYPSAADVDTNIDIIAIHGLDTRSPKTWTWCNRDGTAVNWLADRQMLPAVASQARIFTCDWPSSMWQPAKMTQKSFDELARLFFEGIKTRPAPKGESLEDRPILFVASCLGGLVLVKALVDTGETYDSVRKATRGIVFLSTPFRGTSLEMVVSWARVILGAQAVLRNRQVNNLLDILGGPDFQLVVLIRKFTAMYIHDSLFQLSNFYEIMPTSLPRKAISWLPKSLAQEMPLVDEESATLHMVPNPLPLSRNHVLMNKFSGPECPDYKLVSSKIQQMIGSIISGLPINQADAWILDKYYTPAKLSIERLSGELLPMDQYMDLRISTWDERDQVGLQQFFVARRDKNDQPKMPKRIFLCGGPGTGKTTLCKKIVYEFKNGLWADIFDRVLWIPFQRLKAQNAASMNLGRLLNLAFFPDTSKGSQFADELWRSVDKTEKTLFLLDGLDEVARDIPSGSDAYRLLLHLLNQKMIIVTSRSSSLPAGIAPFDLNLQIGSLSTPQIEEYVQKSWLPTDDMLSFLDQYPAIKDLVCIPAFLDAFCLSWGQSIQRTPSPVLQAMELCLWKKDVLRLEKEINESPLTLSILEDVDMRLIGQLARDEVAFVDGLSFMGLCSNIFSFTPQQQKMAAKLFAAPKTVIFPGVLLSRVSFLQSDSAKNFSFVRPVLRDYFSAKYFVQQSSSRQPLVLVNGNASTLVSAADFAQANRNVARFELFWDFVSDLLPGRQPTPDRPTSRISEPSQVKCA